MANIGDEMRSKRNSMGKSFLEVQRNLNINSAKISAIENYNLSVFSSESELQEALLKYAEYLGFDPKKTFQSYRIEMASFNSNHIVLEPNIHTLSNTIDTSSRGKLVPLDPIDASFETTHTWWRHERAPLNSYTSYDGWFLTSALVAIIATVLLLLNLPSGPVFGISRFTVSFVGGIGGFVLVQWFHPDKIFSRMVYGFFTALMGVTLFGVRLNFEGETGSRFSGLDLSLGGEPNDATIWALAILTGVAMILHYLKSRN